MKKWIIFAVALLLLPACGQSVAEVPPTPTEIPVATLTPSPSPTVLPDLPPTNTPLPTATDAPAVIAQATEPLVETEAATPTETPPPTNTPPPTDTPVPTDTPSPTPVPDWATNSGRTAENLMYLGNPNAPVTMIDFSDFM